MKCPQWLKHGIVGNGGKSQVGLIEFAVLAAVAGFVLYYELLDRIMDFMAVSGW